VNTRECWFERGVEAFQRIAPKAPSVYVCPLCAQCFDRDALENRTLTIEHAPPEALGGRPVCLTCKPCNSSAGHTVDAHMVRREALIDFVTGTMDKPASARFEVGNASVNVDYYNGPAGVLVIGDPKRNSPEAQDRVAKAFEGAHQSGRAQTLSFKVTPSRLGYDARLHVAGALRSAYLIAFAALGYTYIFQRRLERVRRQLRAPDDVVIDCFSVTLPKARPDARRFVFVQDPAHLASILIQMGRQLVFLPWLDDELYSALKQGRERGGEFDVKIHGDQLPWPQEPMHLIDFGRIPGIKIERTKPGEGTADAEG